MLCPHHNTRICSNNRKYFVKNMKSFAFSKAFKLWTCNDIIEQNDYFKINLKEIEFY